MDDQEQFEKEIAEELERQTAARKRGLIFFLQVTAVIQACLCLSMALWAPHPWDRLAIWMFVTYTAIMIWVHRTAYR